MDRFEAMKVFIRVAELESFTQAAESLSLPKASVSMAIRQLESALGARLLQRTTRKVQLTQDGTNFYERALDLIADVDEVESMFRNDGSELRGRIRVDMPIGFARNVITPKLPSFLKLYPNIEVELSCTDRRVDLIREGFDCVIRAGPLADSALIARPLGNMTLINCASVEYIERQGRPKKLDDLKNHLIVRYVLAFGGKDEGLEYFDGEKYRTYKMKSLITVNNSEAYTAACLAGLGIIQSPKNGMQMYIDRGLLTEVLPKFRAQPLPVSLLYPHRRQMAKRVRIFMEWAESVAKDYLK